MAVEHTSVKPASHTCPGINTLCTFKNMLKTFIIKKAVVINSAKAAFLLTCTCTPLLSSASTHWPTAHTNPLRFWVRRSSGFCESPKDGLYCYTHYINKVELNWIKLNPVPWSSPKSIIKEMEQLQTWIRPEQTVLTIMFVRLYDPSLYISLSNVSIHWIKNDPGSGVFVLSILVMYCIVLPCGCSRCNSAPPQERLDQGTLFQNKLRHTKMNFTVHFCMKTILMLKMRCDASRF